MENLPLSDFRAEHILKILKLKPGNVFKCGVVNESKGISEILEINDSYMKLSYTPQDYLALNPISVIIGQVRPICMQRILRDLSSLGCMNYYLTGTETGEKSYLSSNLYKTDLYKKFLLDGAMQAGHSGIGKVLFFNSVKNLLETTQLNNSAYTHKILLDNKYKEDKISQIEFLNMKDSNVLLAIGPERGWTDFERTELLNAGFKSYNMGKNILRTETACVSAVSIILSKLSLM